MNAADAKRSKDVKAIGEVGTMSPELEAEYLFWRLVTEKGFSPHELDTWDMEEIERANAMLDMGSDWQTAYQEYGEAKAKEASENK